MIFFDKINIRVQASKNESDIAFFYDVLNSGEFLTKVIALYLVSLLNGDKGRTRYREEYSLVRANGIGDFSNTIDRILTGPPAELINSLIREDELDELVRRSSNDDWQYKVQVLLYQCYDAFSITHDKLPIKSALRNWFSAFAHFRNKTKALRAI